MASANGVTTARKVEYPEVKLKVDNDIADIRLIFPLPSSCKLAVF